MLKDKRITNVAEDTSDAVNKEVNIRTFTEWFSATAGSDAFYGVHPSGCLYKRDMNAIQFLYILPNPDFNQIKNFFENLRHAPMDANIGNRIFRTFVFILEDDESHVNEFRIFLEKELKANFEARILSEFIVFDFSKGVYEKISGGKIQDKNLRKILDEGCGKIDKDSSVIQMDTSKKIHKLSAINNDIRPIRTKSKITTPLNIIIFMNVFIFIIDSVIFFKTGSKPIENIGIQSNEAVLNGEWWRLITSVFLHADVGHLVGNMFMLFFLDRILRNFYTDFQYWLAYMISGITGSLFTLLMGPSVLSLGASGAIMGMGGVLFYKMFFGNNAKYFRHIGSVATIFITVLYNLIYGLANTGINNYAHFSGFAAGFFVAFTFQLFDNKKKSK